MTPPKKKTLDERLEALASSQENLTALMSRVLEKMDEEKLERMAAESELRLQIQEVVKLQKNNEALINRIGKYAMILARDYDTRIAVLEGKA